MGAERETWIDVARGGCIILVTLLHTTFVVEAAVGPGQGVWSAVDSFLQPLRMPLFFVISGLLAARATRRPWRATRGRTLGMAYLYVIWSFLQLLQVTPRLLDDGDPLPGAVDIAVSLIAPTGLWFFWALAVYFVVARSAVVVLRERAAWVLVPAGVVAVLTPTLEQSVSLDVHPAFGGAFLYSVCANLVWFLFGVFGRSVIVAARERATPVRALLALAVYSALFFAALSGGVPGEPRWLLSGLAVLAAVQALALIPEGQVIVRMVAAVGRRTLPIYALQWYLMHLLAVVIVDQDVLGPLGSPAVVATVATPLLALCVVAVSWGLGSFAEKRPFSVLFHAPEWLVGAPARSKSRTLSELSARV